MPYIPNSNTPVGLASIINAYNTGLPVIMQLDETNYVFEALPLANASPDFIKNTVLKAHPKVLSGKYGVAQIFYDRINLGNLVINIGYDSAVHHTLSDIVPLINIALGIDIQPTDYTNGAISVVSNHISLQAVTSSLRYKGTLSIGTQQVTIILPIARGIPSVVVDSNVIKIYQGLQPITQDIDVAVRAVLTDNNGDLTHTVTTAWLPISLVVGNDSVRIPSVFNPNDGTLPAGTYTLTMQLRAIGSNTNAFATTAAIVVQSVVVQTGLWKHPTNQFGVPYIARTGANQFFLHPGPSLELPSLRFVAPSSDVFNLDITCYQDAQADSNHCEVFINGVSVLSIPNNGTQSSISPNLTAGDVVDITITGPNFGGGADVIDVLVTRTRDNFIFNPGNHWTFVNGAQVLPWVWCYLNNGTHALGSPLLIAAP